MIHIGYLTARIAIAYGQPFRPTGVGTQGLRMSCVQRCHKVVLRLIAPIAVSLNGLLEDAIAVLGSTNGRGPFSSTAEARVLVRTTVVAPCAGLHFVEQ